MTPSIGTEPARDESTNRRLLWPCAVTAMGAMGILLVWLYARRDDSPLTGLRSSGGGRLQTAGYVGDAACRLCHAGIAASYSRHPMGQSLAPIEDAAAQPGQRRDEHAEFAVGGLDYSVEQRGSRIVHGEMHRDRSGRVVASIEAAIRYAIGSGRQGVSYLFERDGFLFQSPITWYAKGQRWGLSPGYENRNSRFDRPVLPDCLFCHANRATPVSSQLNRYKPPIFEGHAIGCERCHGPGERHVREPASSGGSDPTIVNPQNLEPGLRDAVCEQCHLLATRVARPDTRSDDFRPGMPFYRCWSAFVPAGGATANDFAGQPEQMHQSLCYRASQGRLGCISCHDPHVLPAPGEKAAYFRERCLRCHQDAGCSLPAAARFAQGRADDCIACHMPRGESSDNPHVAIANHRIPRAASNVSSAERAERGSQAAAVVVNFHRGLMSAQELAGAERERAIALGQSGSISAAAEALPVLESTLAAHPDDVPSLEAKAQVLRRLGRLAEGLAACRLALARDPTSPTALEGAAYLAGLAGRTQESIEYWKRAIVVNPWQFSSRGELAFAEIAIRDWQGAAHACREALRINPFAMDVRRQLVRSYLHLGERHAARTELEIILGFDPPDRADLLGMLRSLTDRQ
jgi:tetratricopeptide (TPR) repeat protein